VITAGVDLAAQPERTAIAVIEWSAGRAAIKEAASYGDDQTILHVIRQAAKTGIDCPFGWPDAFVLFVTEYHAHRVDVPASRPGSRRNLTMRRTDVVVHDRLRLTPLSVSADRIAHVAFRCADLLAQLEAIAGPVDRAGTGPVAEVYPAASLRSWGLTHNGYKKKTATDILNGLVDHFLDQVPWLDCGTYEQDLRRSHDMFDAVIAAMTARAVAIGQVLLPTADELTTATSEGWIMIPRKPISALL